MFMFIFHNTSAMALNRLELLALQGVAWVHTSTAKLVERHQPDRVASKHTLMWRGFFFAKYSELLDAHISAHVSIGQHRAGALVMQS